MSGLDVEKLKETLVSDELDEKWDEIIEDHLDDKAEQIILSNWVQDYRDEFLELIEDVQNREEIAQSLRIRYIEIKCHWMMLNTRMQYQAVETGSPSQNLMVRGSLISHLLEKLEQFLETDEIEELANFLSQPMAKLKNSDL